MLNEVARSTLLTSTAHAALMFPTLSAAQIARIASRGLIRPIARGDVLIEGGQTNVPFFVVKAGEIEVIRPSGLGLAAAQWPLERSPYLLETSRPGVFAVGDVRCGNIKRVASAVGEGSVAISFVHRVLAESFV